MSKKLIFALLFVPVLAFAANPATLETRSTLHSLVIDVVPVGEEVQYVASVADLRSGEVLMRVNLMRPTTASTFDEKRKLSVRVDLRTLPNALSAAAFIEKDGLLIDSMESKWSLGPAPAGAVSHGSGPLSVGGSVKAPVILHKVEPLYPEEALAARTSGIVILETIIDKTGSVTDVKVVKGLPNGLSEAAVAAVKQWKFEPGIMEGQPVDVRFNLTINFRLDKPLPPPT